MRRHSTSGDLSAKELHIVWASSKYSSESRAKPLSKRYLKSEISRDLSGRRLVRWTYHPTLSSSLTKVIFTWADAVSAGGMALA